MSDHVRLTMAQALLRFLDHQYVERDGSPYKFVHGVLGIFGHGNVLGLGEALESGVSALRYIQAHNEQGMVHAAAAFAKQRDRLGIFACTSSIGPGALNMVTAAAGATINRLPVLLLPGDTFADHQPDPVLQQLEVWSDRTVSVNDAFKPVSVYWDRIMRPEQLLATLPDAMAMLTDPAVTGAVTLSLPQDVQAQAYDYPVRFFDDRVWLVQRRPPDRESLNRVVQLLSTKTRPVIIAGGGVLYSQAQTELAKFASDFHIPVTETQAGKGSLTWKHPWYLGGVGVTGSRSANALLRHADVVLAVGTRLTDFTTASKTLFADPSVDFVAINVNHRDAFKMGSLGLVADAREGLQALTEALRRQGYHSGYDEQGIRDLQASWNAEVNRYYSDNPGTALTQTAALGVVQETIAETAVVVGAAGSLPGDLHRLWRCQIPHTYHLEYGFSCMGYEIAGALGVKWAEPEKDVYALVGDGSFLLLHSELYTSLQEDSKIIVVLFDNQGYGSINSLQKSHGSSGFGTEFRRRTPGSGLNGEPMVVDYAQLADSLGARGFVASSATELREALLLAQRETRSCLIHVKVAMGTGTTDSDAWWRLGVAEESALASTRQAYSVMRAQLEQARWF